MHYLGMTPPVLSIKVTLQDEKELKEPLSGDVQHVRVVHGQPSVAKVCLLRRDRAATRTSRAEGISIL
jgi:hypothetical protein